MGFILVLISLMKFIKLITVSIGEGALPAPEVACLFFEHVV